MSDSHFDAVVVGSGFGGSVMAYRLAEAGLSVCVLERGKAYKPGSYPRAPHELARNFWDPAAGLYGMFHLWQFKHLNALVSSGLGGGSLIYANVLIRKDEAWFADEGATEGTYEPWPVSRADLDPHYDEVEKQIGLEVYPAHLAASTPKTRAYAAAAARAGLDHACLPLAVTFSRPGQTPGEPVVPLDTDNLHGQTRTTCRLCGECDVGCNYGSKNTLDLTYLSQAKKRGAEIRTGADVRAFRALPKGGWAVDYIDQSLQDGVPVDKAKRLTLTAGQLILAAGTLGSTHLMLRNRGNLKGQLPKLGSRFCGNGDILGMAVLAKDEAGTFRELAPNRGPVITSRVRLPDALDGPGAKGRGAYIEDAGFPVFLNWVAESFSAVRKGGRAWGFVWELLKRTLGLSHDTDFSREFSRLISGNELTMASLPMLGMGRDVPDGLLHLNEGGRLDSTWNVKTSAAFFDRVRDHMKILSHQMGAKFQDNPLWWFKRLVTVHPLGGCPMGRHAQEGVVDDHGEVFENPGLFVADGAVMPGPVGPNPSLTIAALADRFANRVIANHKKGISA
ncbi:MAG: GMC family oxidoreductase [Myxococcales bacterium]|nr:GMC family oxidoreductase [Myxococcales bacterium]